MSGKKRMIYDLKNTTPTSRIDFILEKCRGKNVLHVGACQGNDENDPIAFERDAFAQDQWLHGKLNSVSKNCIGIDYNKYFIDYLKNARGVNNIFFFDIEKNDALPELTFVPDVIVLGEIIEHLVNPGMALTKIRDAFMGPETTLLITTPNGLSIWNVLYGILNKETHDRDHSILFTPRLIWRFLDKIDLEIREQRYYMTTIKTHSPNQIKNFYKSKNLTLRSCLIGFIVNIVLRIRPGFADGLAIIATRKLLPQHV